MKKTAIIVNFIIFLAFAASAEAQISIGASIGGGVIILSPVSQGSVNSSVFLDYQLSEKISARLNFLYNSDYQALLPNEKTAYRPFVKGFNLKALLSPDLNGNFYLEEGAGISILNDRVFSDHNNWDYGVVFSLSIAKPVSSNFDLAAGAEYNLTFTGTSVQYFSMFLQGKYNF
jgi:hypothetical protein